MYGWEFTLMNSSSFPASCSLDSPYSRRVDGANFATKWPDARVLRLRSTRVKQNIGRSWSSPPMESSPPITTGTSGLPIHPPAKCSATHWKNCCDSKSTRPIPLKSACPAQPADRNCSWAIPCVSNETSSEKTAPASPRKSSFVGSRIIGIKGSSAISPSASGWSSSFSNHKKSRPSADSRAGSHTISTTSSQR